MKVLVTGVAGFIGSNFIYYYLSEHPERTIIGIDNLSYAGNLENLSELTDGQKERFQFIKADITDPDQIGRIFDSHQIDGVINMAAETHVDRSILDPQAPGQKEKNSSRYLPMRYMVRLDLPDILQKQHH
jgi:dTDP-glucose 4,6-dehydratase